MTSTIQSQTKDSHDARLRVPAPLRATCLLAVALSIAVQSAMAEEPAFSPPMCDPTKVVGHDQCAKCHQPEVQQWMATPHFATFESLHRQPAAKEIAQRLGLGSIKRNDTCLRCHYTQQTQGERVRVTAGVSCESCHGPAADWIDVHADYGGPGISRETETVEHRRQRLAESIARGMNNPRNVYLIARQCYNCHTVPNERLVNVGGHVAGSAAFELVAWSQGMVRHNFVRSGGSTNAESTPAEKRVMYVVGVMTDLEYSLRAVATATEKAPFGVATAQRAVRMKRQLIAIQSVLSDPHIESALAAVATVELRLNNATAIRTAAIAVGQAAFDFAELTDGNTLAAIDRLLPEAAQYKN